jgi:hypothetical protein
MDESGFGALILLIPKNYDSVRKPTPMNRQTKKPTFQKEVCL